MNFDLNPETAHAIVRMTATPEWSYLLTMYNKRRDAYLADLTKAMDQRNIHRLQGAILEIDALLSLRERAELYLTKQTREDSL